MLRIVSKWIGVLAFVVLYGVTTAGAAGASGTTTTTTTVVSPTTTTTTVTDGGGGPTQSVPTQTPTQTVVTSLTGWATSQGATENNVLDSQALALARALSSSKPPAAPTGIAATASILFGQAGNPSTAQAMLGAPKPAGWLEGSASVTINGWTTEVVLWVAQTPTTPTTTLPAVTAPVTTTPVVNVPVVSAPAPTTTTTTTTAPVTTTTVAPVTTTTITPVVAHTAQDQTPTPKRPISIWALGVAGLGGVGALLRKLYLR
jgi:hypothetical protein